MNTADQAEVNKQQHKAEQTDTQHAAAPSPEEEGKATAEGPSQPGTAEEQPQQSQEEILKSQLAAQNDRYLRLSAEFDNYRKRTIKEKADLIQLGGEDYLRDFLPIVDDVERGLKAVESAHDIQGVKDGITLIYNKIQSFLQRKGVQEIQAIGEDFNTDRHEAVVKIAAPDPSLKGKVVDVTEKGYLFHEKVLRFAKVVVGE